MRHCTLHTKRLRQRGATMVEAVVVLPFFIMLFVSSLFVTRRYLAVQAAQSQARSCAWQYSASSCINIPPGCAAKLDDGSPSVDPDEMINTDDIENMATAKASEGASSLAEGVADAAEVGFDPDTGKLNLDVPELDDLEATFKDKIGAIDIDSATGALAEAVVPLVRQFLEDQLASLIADLLGEKLVADERQPVARPRLYGGGQVEVGGYYHLSCNLPAQEQKPVAERALEKLWPF